MIDRPSEGFILVLQAGYKGLSKVCLEILEIFETNAETN